MGRSQRDHLDVQLRKRERRAMTEERSLEHAMAAAEREAAEIYSDQVEVQIDELTDRRAEAAAEVAEAEAAVRQASVALAENGLTPSAKTGFEKSTRRLAELKARLEAFDSEVLPAAQQRRRDASERVEKAETALKWQRARDLVGTQLIPLYEEWRKVMCDAAMVLARVQGVSSEVVSNFHALDQNYAPHRNHVGAIRNLVAITPRPVYELFHNTTLYSGERTDHIEGMRRLFELDASPVELAGGKVEEQSADRIDGES